MLILIWVIESKSTLYTLLLKYESAIEKNWVRNGNCQKSFWGSYVKYSSPLLTVVEEHSKAIFPVLYGGQNGWFDELMSALVL